LLRLPLQPHRLSRLLNTMTDTAAAYWISAEALAQPNPIQTERIHYTACLKPLSDDAWICHVVISPTEPPDSLAHVHGMYKPADRRVRPVKGIYPEDARVTRRLPADPLSNLPVLPTHPPHFKPSKKITNERLDILNINPEGFLWPEEEKLFQHIFQVNERAIAFQDSERGTLREDYFSPYIYPTVDHVPWEQKNIPIPPGIRDKVITELKKQIDAGVYEPCQSSYRSRWFCVAKKDGNLRIVHDLQALNAVSIRDAGTLPVLDDFVESCAGRQCYTVLDLFWGFHARKVHPHHRDITAFHSPLGLLRLTAMPMGYTNSPIEFQNCMVFILQDEIPDTAGIFIDDCAIKGPRTAYLDDAQMPELLATNPGIRRFIWEHALDVHRVLHRFGEAGATISGKKTQCARPSAVILGQLCHKDGRSPDHGKISKIQVWPLPKNITELRGFLGLVGTVRIWIKDFSLITAPLVELKKKGVAFEINTAERIAAFERLKTLVTKTPALRPVDYRSDNPLILSVDSSKYGIGFILSQLDEQGRRRPARYGSLPTNARERNYSQPKIELYGLYRAIRHWRLHLVGARKLVVEVDAKYIRGMLNEPDLQPNATMNRWIQGIMLFDFKLVHVPAEQFKGPDALSRRPLASDEEIEDDDDDDLDAMYLLSFAHAGWAGSQKLSRTRLPYFYGSLPSVLNAATPHPHDDQLEAIYDFLRSGTPPPDQGPTQRKRFLKKAMQFFIKDSLLWRRNGLDIPLRVILSPARRLEILTRAHEEAGHRGELTTFNLVRKRFFWPYLRQDVSYHIRSCHECQIRSTKAIQVPLTVSTPTVLFGRVYIDVMVMPDPSHGYRYIVAARDDLSRAAEGRALRQANSKALARFFWEEIYCRYGAPAQVTTDNGPEVKGAFARLMDRYGLPHVAISPYNSKANGVVERGHFDIREAIVKSCQGRIAEWSTHVPFAFFADKITTNRSTGATPYYLLFGTEPLLPFDLLEATFLTQAFRDDMSRSDLLAARLLQLQKRPEDLAAASAALHASRFKSKERFEEEYRHRMSYRGRDLVKQPLQVGEWVLVENTPVLKSLSRKTKPRYLGPYKIYRQSKGGSYYLCEPDGTVNSRAIARDRLLPYFGRDEDALRGRALTAPRLKMAHEAVEEASPFDAIGPFEASPVDNPPQQDWREPAEPIPMDNSDDSASSDSEEDDAPLGSRLPTRDHRLPARYRQ
jgi:hypothetical protein